MLVQPEYKYVVTQRTAPTYCCNHSNGVEKSPGETPQVFWNVFAVPVRVELGGHHLGLPATHQRLAEELAHTCYLTFAR